MRYFHEVVTYTSPMLPQLSNKPVRLIEQQRDVKQLQHGVLRTNCLDCLDRTNVFQAKVCLKVLEELLPLDFTDGRVGKLLFTLWSISGDFISKVYSGQCPTLAALTQNGQNLKLPMINHGVTSVKRML